MKNDKKGAESAILVSGKHLGLDDSSSGIVIANLNATTLPMCVGMPIDDIETDDINLLLFIIDASGSMDVIRETVIDGFNDICIGGIKGGSSSLVSTIEVGGIIFNERICSMWNGGFAKIQDLPALTRNDYCPNGTTALNQAVKDGVTALVVRAAEITKMTGLVPRAWLVVLSDGANNCPPHRTDDIKLVVESLNPEIFVKVFAGFETKERVDFKQVAGSLGFNNPFEMKAAPGQTIDDLKRNFRHMLGIMSSAIIKQSSSKITGNSSASFWNS